MTETIPTPYEDLLRKVVETGHLRSDRTGVGTYSIFGEQIRYDLSLGFPLLTTKRVHFRSVVAELLWFLRGDTNVDWLHAQGVSIWDEWADENGDLGPVYGKQWRNWQHRADNNGVDQITRVIDSLGSDPYSRRHIVSAWNVHDLPKMALAPCHVMFQFYVRPNSLGMPTYLDCQVYQRSADIFLGVPFNIASYALLTHIMAHQTGYTPGELVWTGGDVHLYTNHVRQAQEQLSRHAMPYPHLVTEPEVKSLDKYQVEDFNLYGYRPHPAISAPVAV